MLYSIVWATDMDERVKVQDFIVSVSNNAQGLPLTLYSSHN